MSVEGFLLDAIGILLSMSIEIVFFIVYRESMAESLLVRCFPHVVGAVAWCPTIFYVRVKESDT